mgnify:CR=1 FL=1
MADNTPPANQPSPAAWKGWRRQHSKGKVHFAARLTSLIVLVFMTSVLFARPTVGDEAMVTIQDYLWIAMVAFLNFQLLETCRRQATDFWGFVADSGLALLGLIGGLAYFLLRWTENQWFAGYQAEEDWIIAQTTAWVATDLIWGALISLRIAFAPKERDEL